MDDSFKEFVGAAGDLDPEFNGGGILRFNYTEEDQVRLGGLYDVVVGGDERIYMAGSVVGFEYAITVLNSDGSFAVDFGREGTLFGRFPGVAGSSFGDRIALENDHVLLLGSVEVEKSGREVRCPSVVRYDLSGNLDADYGTGGYCIINPDFHDGSDEFLPLEFSANWTSYDNKRYVSAFRVAGEGTEMVVTCLDADGHIVTAFGNEGIARIKHPRGPQLREILVKDDGVYLAGSFSRGGVGYLTFCRLTFSGELDETFGESGFTTIESPNSDIFSLVQQKNNKILGVGRSVKEEEEGDIFIRYVGALVSLDGEGGIDREFNGGKPLYTELSYSTVWGLGAVQSDGKIITFGMFSDPRDSRFVRGGFAPVLHRHADSQALSQRRLVLARFLEDGSFDTSFGRVKPGWIEFNLSENSNLNAMAAQPDNKAILVGTLERDFIVLRFKG